MPDNHVLCYLVLFEIVAVCIFTDLKQMYFSYSEIDLFALEIDKENVPCFEGMIHAFGGKRVCNYQIINIL